MADSTSCIQSGIAKVPLPETAWFSLCLNTTKSGKYSCIKFSPLLIEGTIFKGGEEMRVWVTDDKNKIPVRVESPIIVGSVYAELYKYSGLRSPVSAKLQ